ncbi:type II secretion system F family protein [Nocardioides sp.]|uniref:type II secretion system F family protein n=1 Tax=Nocardioides sp. TaxID=35761 RepID=UPI0027338032|nr:type II secretion system F family protein [Nocardioides sp.]MDP3894121.1 type II secretion system F family protein [Nocardioides sp.]
MILLLGVALVFAALFLVFSSIGGLTEERGGVARSLEMLEAMNNAPKELSESEADRPFGERVLEPLYLRAQRLGRRLSGADSSERVRHKLDLAGNPPGWNVDRVAAGKVVGSFVGFAFAALAAVVFGIDFPIWILVVLAGTAVGFMAPNMYLYQRAYERTEKMQRELPDAIDLLTISVESGLAFDSALQQVARKTEGPIGEEFARVLQEMQIGRSRAESMRSLADRTNMPDLRAFVSAMVQADSFGIPIGQVLRVQSHEIRTKRRQWAEEKAQKVPVKITVPLIFCILPCLFIAVLGPAAITIMRDLM